MTPNSWSRGTARWFKVMGVTLGILLAVAAAIGLAFWLFVSNLRGNSILAESVARGASSRPLFLDAIAERPLDFQLRCLSSALISPSPDDGGNIFVTEGDSAVRALWISDHRLRIEHRSFVRIVKAEPLCQGVV